MDSSTKEVIMGDNTTSVDYSVLDSAMINVQSILNDPYVSVTLGRLKAEFEYSQSDYVSMLCELTDNMESINGIVNDLLLKSKYMLQMAKKIYSDADVNMADSIK